MKNILNLRNYSILRNFFLLVSLIVLSLNLGCGVLSNPDLQKVQGVWETKLSNNVILSIIVEGENISILDQKSGEFGQGPKFILDSSKTPKQFTLLKAGNNRQEDVKGIFEIADKKLKIGLSDTDPTTFTDKDTFTFEYKGKSKNFAPEDFDYIKGVKTWNYYVGANRIIKDNPPNFDFKNADTPDKLIEVSNKAKELIKKVSSELSSLPVSDVDNKVTSHSSEYVRLFSQLDNSLSELIQVANNAKVLIAKRNSDDMGGQVLMDILRGQFGKTQDMLDAEGQEIKDRAEKAMAKLDLMDEDFANLEKEELQIRSYLSDKYKREFPKF